MDELSIYEKNLSQLLDNYEKARTKYINDIRLSKGGEAPATASAIASLNQEIVFLLEEISHKLNQNQSKNAKYNDVIAKKRDYLNDLNNKMRADETKINALLNDTISLDGKNQTLRLQTKSSMYYNTINVILIVILVILFARVITSSETNLTETVTLSLGLLWLFYIYRASITAGLSYIKDSIVNISYYRLLD